MFGIPREGVTEHHGSARKSNKQGAIHDDLLIPPEVLGVDTLESERTEPHKRGMIRQQVEGVVPYALTPISARH